MGTPLRRSRRLVGLKPEATEVPASASRARRALVDFESGPEEARDPGSPVSAPQPDPASPRGERAPGLEPPPRPPEARPEAPQSEPSPGSPPPRRKSGPGSPEPEPGRRAPGPEPAQPPREPTPPAAGPARAQREPSPPAPAAETATGSFGPQRRREPPDRAPAPARPREQRAEVLPAVPRGRPKSGRVWKDRSKKRFSQMVRDKPLRTSWQRKMEERQERKLTKDLARHLQEEKALRRQEKKQRRAENLRRRLENERKAEVVQVIRNPAKLKRVKKKQLRSIQKRDTLTLLQTQQPRRPAAEA